MSDNVNSPSHYADHCSIECIDMIRLVLGREGFDYYCIGNAIKYLWRNKYKNGREDLRKSEVYINWISERSVKQRDELKRILAKQGGA